MRVLVCGSRTWTNTWTIQKQLQELPKKTVIVHGDARGADQLAAAVAQRLGLLVEAHPADWARWGKAAGPRRNQNMLRPGVDMCIAFRALGHSPGTDDMVRRCREVGVPVRLVYQACPPGFHKGIRQSDGSLRCRVCGAARPASC